MQPLSDRLASLSHGIFSMTKAINPTMIEEEIP